MSIRAKFDTKRSDIRSVYLKSSEMLREQRPRANSTVEITTSSSNLHDRVKAIRKANMAQQDRIHARSCACDTFGDTLTQYVRK